MNCRFASLVGGLLLAGVLPGQVVATWGEFGSGCPGTGAGLGQNQILPAVANTSWGSGNAIPLGWSPNRFQQFFLGSELPSAMTMASLALRQPHTGPTAAGFSVDLDIKVGYTSRWAGTISSTFAANWDLGSPVQVLPRSVVVFPDQHTVPQVFSEMVVTIPWPVHFDWVPQPGRNLLVEITVYGNSVGSGIYGYPIDNVSGTYGQWGTPANATTANGGAVRAFGPVMAFGAWTQTAVPRVYSTGTPQIGDTFRVRIAQARAAAPVLLLMGLGISSCQGLPLPLDLGAYGAPGCSLLIDPFDTQVVVSNASGQGSFQYSIPNNIYALGLHFYEQAFPADPGANALGLAASNGGVGLIGNQ